MIARPTPALGPTPIPRGGGILPRMDRIVIRGAREHNLKNISLELPRGKFIVITGVSGSGKSTLAFDTIYAEGQRRYVESLSSYARQFLGVMDKPEVESIEGLSPAISIDQKTTSHNPRSTVGTVTEIHDYLRLLFARVGQAFCPECGRPIEKQSASEITDRLLKRLVYGVGTRMVVSWGAPALGGVYKLVAVRENGTWAPAMKVSNSLEKVLNPGHKRVYRVYDERGLATADLLALAEEEVREDAPLTLRHPTDPTKRRTLRPGSFRLEPLLEEVYRGRRLFPPLPLEELRKRRDRDVALLDPGVRRLVNPHVYHVSLTERLFALKEELVRRLEG
mgnify:CR=1 FL=1